MNQALILPDAAKPEPRTNVRLSLACGQCIELEVPAFVPQPGVGVGHAGQANRGGEGGRSAYGALDLGHHLRCVAWRAQPTGGRDVPVAVNFNLEDAHGVEQWR